MVVAMQTNIQYPLQGAIGLLEETDRSIQVMCICICMMSVLVYITGICDMLFNKDVAIIYYLE